MKNLLKLGLALGVVAFAVSFAAPVAANPDPPPNDNVCICHLTQGGNSDAEGPGGNPEPNENQKYIEICVDPNSTGGQHQFEQHLQHGDFVAGGEGCQPD